MGAVAAELGLGIAFTIISLAPSIPDWMKKNEGPQLRVQVRTGLPLTEGMDEKARKEEYGRVSMGGSIPNVVLFNAAGDRIANYHNHNDDKMGHNAPHDIFADYHDGGNTQTPEYLTITAGGPDAICITSVTVTPPNTAEMWAFVPGEVAAECAKVGKEWPWGYSDASVQISSADGKTKEDVRPKCLWLDRGGWRDGTFQENNIGFEGFQVHLPDFKLDNSKWKEWEGDLHQMCDSVSRFAVFETLNDLQCPQKFDPPPPQSGQRLPWKETSACHPDIWHPDIRSDPALTDNQATFIECSLYGKSWCPTELGFLPGQTERRSAARQIASPRSTMQRRRTSQFAGQLKWSQDERVSAIELCQSPASRGADLYSEPEKMFCDMDTHTLYPACKSNNGLEACFDPAHNVTMVPGAGNQKRELKPYYTDIQHWPKLN